MDERSYEVVIAAFNAEKYLAEAIQSVLESSAQPRRIWVVDDASTDRTADIAKQFSKVELLRNEQNRERSYSRNIALERCESEFVQILDADDLIHPEKIDQQLDYFESYPEVDVTLGDVQIFTNEYKKTNFGEYRTYGELDILEQLIRKNTFAIHSMLFRRSFFERFGYFREDLPISEDRELYIRGILSGAHFLYTPNALCFYRMHETGTIRSRQSETAYYNALPIREHREQLATFEDGAYRSVTGESLRMLARNANIHKRPFEEVVEIIQESEEMKPFPAIKQNPLYSVIENITGPVMLERILRLKF